jgi:2,4-diaminopentanoate dehydrogenase
MFDRLAGATSAHRIRGVSMSLRVVQWATGDVGSFCLQQVIDNAGMELVGVWVSGRRRIAATPETCVIDRRRIAATMSKEAIFALDADVVIHTSAPFGHFDDDVARLLESGKNVVSTVAYFSPWIDGPDVIKPLERACQAGETTLFGTGLDPGFVADRVAALMTGSVMHVRRIDMVETLDVSTCPATQLLKDIGFGKPPEELRFDNVYIQHFVQRMFPAAIGKLSDQLDLQLDEVRPTGMPELAIAPRDLDIAIGHLPKGSITGASHEFGGYRDGELLVTHKWVHFADREGSPSHWPMPPQPRRGEAMPYRAMIDIQGRPNLSVDMLWTDVEDTVFLPTATIAVQSIPEVVAAGPGILLEPTFGAWKPTWA